MEIGEVINSFTKNKMYDKMQLTATKPTVMLKAKFSHSCA